MMQPSNPEKYDDSLKALTKVKTLLAPTCTAAVVAIRKYRETPKTNHGDTYNTDRVMAEALAQAAEHVEAAAHIAVCAQRFLKGDMTYEEFGITPCFHRRLVQR
jgi:hypothetical protein